MVRAHLQERCSIPSLLEVGPILRLGVLGERFSSPSGLGQSPSAKRY